MAKTRTQEVFEDYKAKISLKYITQTKDEMLKEIEEEKEVNTLHNIKVVVATSIDESLIIPSPNTEEDAKYMEKLGFILHEDKYGKYHVDEDKAEKDSEAEIYTDRVRGLRKETADIVMKKIKEAMAIDENRVMITTEIYGNSYKNRIKYFDVWLSPELKRAGFKSNFIDANHYSISW